MTTPEQHTGLEGRGEVLDQAAMRRRLLLARLGQGAAGAAMLAPLSGRAAGTFKISNPSLAGGFGYCSVSGFQSAAISGGPSLPVCSAYAPSHFVAVENLIYTGSSGVGTLLDINGINASKLAEKLNGKYKTTAFTGEANNKSGNVLPLMASVMPSPPYVAVLGTGVVLIWTSSNSSTALTRREWPSSNLIELDPFSTIFSGSSDARPLLLVLYDGVQSPTSPVTANCWFLSAYLTIYKGTPNTLPVGFDTTYLTAQYGSDSDAASDSTAYSFLKELCVTP